MREGCCAAGGEGVVDQLGAALGSGEVRAPAAAVRAGGSGGLEDEPAGFLVEVRGECQLFLVADAEVKQDPLGRAGRQRPGSVTRRAIRLRLSILIPFSS